MRGTLAKRMRKHIAKKYPFLVPDSQYVMRWDGVILLANTCRRKYTQEMKRNYRAMRRMA
jgi:hypothetical protein